MYKKENLRVFKDVGVLKRVYRNCLVKKIKIDKRRTPISEIVDNYCAKDCLEHAFTWAFSCEGRAYWRDKFLLLYNKDNK